MDDAADAIVCSARAIWPDIHVEPRAFADYVASRIPQGVSVAQASENMHIADLYLACACAGGDLRAIAAFEERYLNPLDRVLAGLSGLRSDVVDEVKQQIRYDLLVAPPPKIIKFSGRGPLSGWVRVMAVRQALALVRKTRRERPVEHELIEKGLPASSDPELQYFRGYYQRDFTAAVAEALRMLDRREQTLLRQRFVDGLNIDELGAFYCVHRATAARWLERAQESLARQTHALLKRTLQVESAELNSLFRVLRSKLEVSLPVVFPAKVKRRAVRR